MSGQGVDKMTKIDIISGFLGAGKTTLIKKLLKEGMVGEQVVLIENEFGEIGVDGGFLKEAGIEIREMNSGCICCSLVGDFATSLKEVMDTYKPQRILIEPSGVGKLSDVLKAVEGVSLEGRAALNSKTTVVDANKCKMYLKNFGEFFINQIEHADTIILSRTGTISQEKLGKVVELIRQHNEKGTIITTPWEQLDGKDMLEAMEGADKLEKELRIEMEGEHHEHTHHDHKEGCGCGCGHDHEHHHADEIFTSFGLQTPKVYNKEEIEEILNQLEKEEVFGFVLRAKGMVDSGNGDWTYFDYVPGESNIREGAPCVTGKICVIGSNLQEQNLQELFEGRQK